MSRLLASVYRGATSLALLAVLLSAARGTHAQKHAAAHAAQRAALQGSVPVVMLSDPHFDPYQDPAKVARLLSAPVTEWAKILALPPSATQAVDYANLQKTCLARGPDPSFALLSASLHAAHAEQPRPLFVTVSGDLLVHGFDCRYRKLAPAPTDKGLAEFSKKTVDFVAQQFRAAFPGVPVFIALGNNDTGCGDYVETMNSDFLQSAGRSIAAGMPDTHNRNDALQSFSDQGDYSVLLTGPMVRTRLIVLQDLFESRQFRDCAQKTNQAKMTDTQIVWLQAQLDEVRKHGEQAWVMAHIPPGVDVYSSFHRYVLKPENICEVTVPVEMLSSDALSSTLTAYADVVRLAVFAHTHMDEMKLLHNSSGGMVPVKLVPSISPVNGNSPAFLVAQVDPHSATLKDWSVFVARAPDASSWGEAYRYSRAYGKPDYSAASVMQLTSRLAADKGGDGDLSRTYQRWFYPGDVGLFSLGLHQIWPAYACAMVEEGGTAFHQCMCPAGK